MNLLYVAAFIISVLLLSVIYWLGARHPNWVQDLSEKAKAKSSLEEVQRTVLALAEKIGRIENTQESISTPFVGNWTIDFDENSILLETKSKVSNIAPDVGWILINQTENRKVIIYEKSQLVSDGFVITYKLELIGLALKSEKNFATNPKAINVYEQGGTILVSFEI